MAGEFDTVALDRRCRFLLVGRNLIEKKHERSEPEKSNPL
jgi:hypothetical protein